MFPSLCNVLEASYEIVELGFIGGRCEAQRRVVHECIDKSMVNNVPTEVLKIYTVLYKPVKRL